MSDNIVGETSTDKYLKIVKFILIIACLFGTVFRTKIEAEYVNVYMAGVNVASFLIATNLWMYDCYFKLCIRSKEIQDNIFKKNRIENIAMIFYVSMFIVNLVLLYILYFIYFVKSYDMTILNDCLGIISLGFALTTDYLSDFVVGIISFIE